MKPLLELKNVSRTYWLGETPVRALRNVSLVINKGDFLAIMGPSGSGKSTLMHIMGLLDRPDKGEVYLHQRPVGSLSEEEQARVRNQEVGFVFQFFYLLPKLSALENVKLPLLYAGVSAKEQEKRAREALAKVGMIERARHHPSQLSGGERQRVAIARALVNNPSLILADEPTGNLDSRSGRKIMEILADLNKEGRTVVLITHDSSLVSWAHSLVKIKDGRVVEKKNL